MHELIGAGIDHSASLKTHRLSRAAAGMSTDSRRTPAVDAPLWSESFRQGDKAVPFRRKLEPD